MAKEERDDKEYFNASIRNLVPINELSPQLQNEVIRVGDVLKIKKKEFIFKQGDRDNYAFYLLEGDVEMIADNHVHSTLQSSSDSARYAMARLQPRQFSAKAKTELYVFEVERSALDRLMVSAQQSETPIESSADMEVSHISEEDDVDWMTRMLQSELFCRLPTANIHQLFALLEAVEYKTGDFVIKQGEVGDNFYIIQEGVCEVIRAPSEGAKPIKLAELHAGDGFGEEALLTEAKRNASITMKTDGILMQLSKDNFINLIKKPTLDEVTYKEAVKLVDSGATWLDVRFANEFEESSLKGSINIPLNVLRMQTEKLDKSKKYVVYCDTAGRSSAAAYLLTDRGFDVSYLRDGMTSIPASELEQSTVTGGGKNEATAPTPEAKKPQPASKPAQEPEPEEEDDLLDRSIAHSIIETGLAKTDFEIEKNKKKLANAEEEQKDKINDAMKKLEAEKKKLEAEKKSVEKESKKYREQEEARIEKLKQDAEKRLAKEKQKLEEIYSKNTEEMENLQKMKEEAEAQLRVEREKLERDSAEARKKLEEAEEIRKRVEESKAALDKDAETKKQQQAALERAIQLKAKAKIEQERRKMAEQVSRNTEELEKARRAQAAAEAARSAAESEAKNIIEEYKKQFEEERAAERAKLDEERKKLEEESRKIRESMEELQRNRQEAESARQEASQEVQALREKQTEASSSGDAAAKKQTDELMKLVEERLKKAEENLANVQKKEVSVAAKRVLNEQELKKQKEEEEKLRQQVEADLEVFMEEQEKEQPTEEMTVAQADHIKRIKERAAAAKKAAAKATDNLFSDVAGQFGKDD